MMGSGAMPLGRASLRGNRRRPSRAAMFWLLAVLMCGLASGPASAVDDIFSRAMAAGDQARVAGKFKDAEARYREAATSRVDSAEARYKLGLVISYQKRLVEASRWLTEASRLSPTDTDIQLAVGRVASWRGRYVEAARVVDAVVAERPGNLEARLLAARVNLYRGRLDVAAAGFREVLKAEPRNVEAALGLGDSLAARDKRGALKAYREALAIDPASVDARRRIADLTKPPQPPPTSTAPQPTDDPAARAIRDGLAARVAGKFSEAEALFREAVAKRPELVEAHLNLALTLGFQGKIEEGLAALEPGEKLAPNDGDLLIARARLLAWKGNFGGAGASLERVLAASPGNLEAKSFAARIAYYQERYDTAGEGFNAVLTAAPDNVEALVGLGDVKVVQGEEDEGAAFYGKALELRPDLDDVRRRRDRLYDPSGYRWRLDTGDDHSTSPAGSGRADWDDVFVQATYAVDARTQTRVRFEWSRRFDIVDHFFEVGVDRKFNSWASAHAEVGFDPNAVYLPRLRFGGGVTARLNEGGSLIGPTIASLDAKRSRYVTGTVVQYTPGVQQYFIDGRLWLSGTMPWTLGETGKTLRGWSFRADAVPLPWLHLFGGLGAGAETISNRTAGTRNHFAGVTASLSDRIDVTAAAASSSTDGTPRRDTYSLALTSRF